MRRNNHLSSAVAENVQVFPEFQKGSEGQFWGSRYDKNPPAAFSASLTLFVQSLEGRNVSPLTIRLERLNEESKRRTHANRIFSNREARVRLALAICAGQSDDSVIGKRGRRTTTLKGH